MKRLTSSGLLVLVLVGLTLVPLTARSKPNRSNSEMVRERAVQALTYENVVSHFKSAHLRATEVQKRCTIFFEGEWRNANIYSYGVIIVENSDEDVQVTFYLTDAHEMNWVTEFLDAPFFTRDETGKLFDIVNATTDTRGKLVGRFRVDFHHWQPKHAEILLLSFTPAR